PAFVGQSAYRLKNGIGFLSSRRGKPQHRSRIMKRQPRLLAILALLALALPAPGMTPEQRRMYLDKFVQTVPAVPSFNAWLQRSGELPPDFDALPKINGLPDPLQFVDGRVVKTAADWKTRRTELYTLEQKY